ncbi:MAG: hypothetical protein JW900_02215 [Anaerolineae bacterium]|nr:hypothetical protein [Anaerolineae bacterium]
MLERIELDKSLPKEEYVRNLARYQIQLRELAYQLYVQKRSLVIVYEGWDAGGKGGNIKRVTEKLDPRGYEVFSIAAPRGEDGTHHYLWRFWRRLRPPNEKQVLIFDRSWYGRVMVERVEGFCSEGEWKRAYREVNEFERQLSDHGIILAKFWIHISFEEQLRRFQDREQTAYKAWKLTEEDWRNRTKWAEYEQAVGDMLLRTSTLTAPWTIVEGNDKWFARVKTLRTLVELLSRTLDYQPFDPGAASSQSKKKGKKMDKKEEKIEKVEEIEEAVIAAPVEKKEKKQKKKKKDEKKGKGKSDGKGKKKKQAAQAKKKDKKRAKPEKEGAVSAEAAAVPTDKGKKAQKAQASEEGGKTG